MFVQTSKTTINGKTYECKTVRESFRTPKGPRSRLVCNISKLPENIQDAIESLLKNPQAEHVSIDELTLHDACGFGGVAVLHDAWDRYRLDTVLSEITDSIVLGRIKAMVFGRLLFPGSKLSLKTQSADSALAASCGLTCDDLDEDRLYEAMDALSGKWAGIEKALYSDAFPGGVPLVLYDLTSSYFEGANDKRLAAYGYSRDHPQVILALATGSDGVPIHMEVLKGNRADNATLLPLLASLQRRFGISKAVFSFDGGMSSALNLRQMREDGLGYVTRLSSSTLQALLAQLPAEHQPELWDRTDLAEFEFDGIRYVAAGSEYRRQRDRERREARIAKGRAALEKFNQVQRRKIDIQKLASQVGRMLERGKCLKYFTFHIEENGYATWSEKQDVIEAEEHLDGWYLLTTSLAAEESTKEDVLEHYRNLLEVEDAFRETKNHLKVRPVYHQKDNRMRNHIRICFLAYWISARLRREWGQLGETREVPLILKQLQQIRVGRLKVKGKIYKALMTDIPQSLYIILDQLLLLRLFRQVPEWAL